MKQKLSMLWTLFWTFAKMGVMTFGGGMAMLPILQREVVDNKHWATEEELVDYFAIGQCTPGIIAVNTATFIGQKYAGIAGGIVATLGVVFPSLLIIVALAGVITSFSHLTWVQHAFAGIRVCVCVLIFNAVLKLWKSAVKDVWGLLIFLAVLAASLLTSLSPVWYVLAAGVAVLILAFTQYGLLAGLAVSVIPAALCILWVTLRNPAISMLGLFVVNYFIMALTRYAHDLPFGMILDALIFYNILIISLQAMMHRIEWKRASSGLTVVAAIWVAYCVLEVVNPESVSVSGWFSSVRSVAFYFFFIVVLTQLTMNEYKYLKYMLVIWSVLTLIAVGKACIQKFFGFNAAENYWLFVLGGRSTHIIHSGVRYFSFFSDAANFGGSMGLSMVVFSISALYYRNPWMKIYLLLVAAAACYGMLISGTRSALAVPFVGYTAFIMMSRNIKVIVMGVLLVIAAFVFLKFTSIGQGNALVRRARSAFNSEDPSFKVRLENQAKLREIMADKPFGAGLGHGGGKAKTFTPTAPLSQIPTDSWFVMIWVETGVVGILLHIGILLYILARGAYLVVFKLRNTQLRGFTAALTAGISGIVVMAYANEILGQIPTGAILYMSMGFIFLAPRFDRELSRKEILDKATAAQQPPLRENYE